MFFVRKIFHLSNSISGNYLTQDKRLTFLVCRVIMGTLKVWSSFIFLVFLPSITTASTEGCLSSTSCSGNHRVTNFEIRFPFRLRDRHPQNCAYPGFDLSCTESKETVLELPFSGRFLVRNINYTNQEVEIYDPGSCLMSRLLDFNLSGSPFKGKEYSNYTFFNCSKGAGGYGSCSNSLSSTYHIQSFPSNDSIRFLPPDYCNLVKEVSVPQQYDYQNDFSLSLTWNKPNCRKCESQGGKCIVNNYTTLSIGCFRVPVQPTYTKEKTMSKTTKIAIGLSVGLVVFLVATLTIRACKKNDTEEKENQLKIEKFLENYKSLNPTRYSYADIKRMTNKFKNKLGQGGYGSVFEGKLTNGIPVAVKILNNFEGNGEEFINEVGTIGRIHHINVVRLLGFCADGFRRALIYEFMPNESLEKFIFSGKDRIHYLSWVKLQDIAISIARGIEYLHQGCDLRILHFDIKPHNILLDHNFNPKISDFGLAKLCSKGDSIISMTAARGTMGYIAPEVFSTKNVSYKSDIYSFGMLLLEMVGGRKNIDVNVEQPSQVYFPEWIYYHLDQGKDLTIHVETENDINIAKKLTMVALWCIQWHPVDRPTMKSVLQMLEAHTENLIMPPNPFASTAPVTTPTTIPHKPQQTELTVIQEESERGI